MDGVVMFEIEERGSLEILRMTHGKANLIDADLSEGLSEKLDEMKKSEAVWGDAIQQNWDSDTTRAAILSYIEKTLRSERDEKG